MKDAVGNLIKDKDGYQYEYDYENRIVRIVDVNDVEVATFDYDALGRRIRKVDSKADETILYYYNDNWQVLCEYDGSDSFKQLYAYGNYIDEVLVKCTELTIRYYVHDHLYSPVALISYPDGTVVERYEYDAYGDVTIMSGAYQQRTTSSYDNPYYFTGRHLDMLDINSNGMPRLKIMYYRNRYYDPETGRFFQHDQLGINPKSVFPNPFMPFLQYTDGMSLYEYVRNNPTSYIDPLGLIKWGDIENESDCIQWCKEVRDDSLDTAKWLYDLAKNAIEKWKDDCYAICDDAFPPGCPSPDDPLGANEGCKFSCDTLAGLYSANAYAGYTAALGGTWYNYGSCWSGCKVMY